MKIRKFLPSIILPVMLLAWVLGSRIPPSSQISINIEAPKTNFLAPNFTLGTVAGSSITLADLKGQPIILNFWASWCPPCRAEMPAFQQAWQEYSHSSLVILSVNVTNRDSRADIDNFIDDNHLDFPVLLDVNGSVSKTYQIHSLPTTFIINKDGVIINTLIGGPIPLSLLRVQADQLLQENVDVSDH